MKRWLAALTWATALAAQAAGSIEDFVKGAEFNDPRIIQSQLQQGVDPNLTDSRGRTALFTAVREGSERALAALLASPKLDVDAANANGETPLMLAAIRGSLPMVQALVARGAAVNRAGWTPLHYACSGPDNGVAAFLIARGADLNARSENGTTPLMMAARYGGGDLVPLLLKAGAEPRAANEQELTAADFATRGGRDAMAKELRRAMQERQRAADAAKPAN
jgi:ankyrin repeat protein